MPHMTKPKPHHLRKKVLNRKRLTLSKDMKDRLNAFHDRFPSVSRATLARIARKDPRILEISPEKFESNVIRTGNLLNAVPSAFFKLAQTLPALVYQDPKTLRLKTRSLAKKLSMTRKELLPLLWKKPSLLSRTEAALFGAISDFAAHFAIEPLLAQKLFVRYPSLWSVSLPTVIHNLEDMARLLDIPLPIMTRAVFAQPQLFYQKPQTILRNVTDSAHALDLSFSSYLAIALGQPSLLARNPRDMRRKKRLITHLMRYTNDHRTFEDFLHAFKSALTYSPERILARCLIARWKLSSNKTARLLSMPNKTATLLLRAHLKRRNGDTVYPFYQRWKKLGLLTAD